MALFPRRRAIVTPIVRLSAVPTGLAGELAVIAAQTSDAVARAALNGIIPRVAILQRTKDELLQQAMEEAHLPGALQ